MEVSRENAADFLTVRRFLHLIHDKANPGSEGRPRYVVVSGDQPSYEYLVEIWLESWRKPKHESSRFGEHALHEWLIPFRESLHAERQTMYSVYKEMLDGLGLDQLAEFAGLSESQVKMFLSHAHARNNRAVLFDLTCAMIIHLAYMAVAEDATVAIAVKRLHE